MDQNSSILIVDDEPAVSKVLGALLAEQGYNLSFASSGMEALDKVKESIPSLILMDVVMPDIDGYEVARRLRNSGDEHLEHVPVIAITANALRGDAEKAIAAGCDVYMSKPINIRELWARVGALLQAD